MDKPTIKEEKKLVLTQIKETPFSHATDGEKNYLTCGRTILEIDKNEQETKEWLEEKPWLAISLLTESLINEMSNNKK